MADFTAKKAAAAHPERIVSGAAWDDDARLDASVRPQTLDEYIGQKRVKENIAIAIEAARTRGEALDHVLLYGPPGLGKTTLAQIIANELNVSIKTSAGPLLERKGDLTAILTSLDKKEVFFLDEIHRLQAAVEEVLYPAMEDFRVDLVIGLKEREAELGFSLIAPRIHAYERATNTPSEPRTARGIQERTPHHVARNGETDAADPKIKCARRGP